MRFLIEWANGAAQLVHGEANAEFFRRQGARVRPVEGTVGQVRKSEALVPPISDSDVEIKNEYSSGDGQ